VGTTLCPAQMWCPLNAGRGDGQRRRRSALFLEKKRLTKKESGKKEIVHGDFARLPRLETQKRRRYKRSMLNRKRGNLNDSLETAPGSGRRWEPSSEKVKSLSHNADRDYDTYGGQVSARRERKKEDRGNGGPSKIRSCMRSS